VKVFNGSRGADAVTSNGLPGLCIWEA